MSGHLNSQVLFGTHPVCFTEGGDHYASKSCIHATKARLLSIGRNMLTGILKKTEKMTLFSITNIFKKIFLRFDPFS
jgi:hypothetical protein